MLSLFALLAPAPTAPAVTVQAVRGQGVTLAVEFPHRELLLSREAPNLLRLVTPWQTVQARPTGTPHPQPAFAEYFGQGSPLKLPVRVPVIARPGLFTAQLQAQFFVCEPTQKLCTQRNLHLPVKIRVLAADGQPPAAVQWLRLQPVDLRSPGIGRNSK